MPCLFRELPNGARFRWRGLLLTKEGPRGWGSSKYPYLFSGHERVERLVPEPIEAAEPAYAPQFDRLPLG